MLYTGIHRANPRHIRKIKELWKILSWISENFKRESSKPIRIYNRGPHLQFSLKSNYAVSANPRLLLPLCGSVRTPCVVSGLTGLALGAVSPSLQLFNVSGYAGHHRVKQVPRWLSSWQCYCEVVGFTMTMSVTHLKTPLRYSLKIYFACCYEQVRTCLSVDVCRWGAGPVEVGGIRSLWICSYRVWDTGCG